LFQVEYAKEAVKRGATICGLVFKDGIVLATVKPVIGLMVGDSIEKVFQIDDHAAAVAAGLLADARVLVNQSRVRAQIHKITYEEPIDIWSLSRVIGDRMQISTLYAGLRPFGVSFLIGGVDKTGPHLIESDPSGMLFEWQAYAIGRGAVLANKIFKQRWKPNMADKEAVALVYDVINKTEKDKKDTFVDMAIIKKNSKFMMMHEEAIKRFVK
jgi:proteasome alpha subunit